MQSNKMYHIELIKLKAKTFEGFTDFTHHVFIELGTTIAIENEKYIWISDDDQLFINLAPIKSKKSPQFLKNIMKLL
jgi:hypothetical protein